MSSGNSYFCFLIDYCAYSEDDFFLKWKKNLANVSCRSSNKFGYFIDKRKKWMQVIFILATVLGESENFLVRTKRNANKNSDIWSFGHIWGNGSTCNLYSTSWLY